MECQNIKQLLNDTIEQPPQFRTKNWIEVIDISSETSKV